MLPTKKDEMSVRCTSCGEIITIEIKDFLRHKKIVCSNPVCKSRKFQVVEGSTIIVTK